MRYTLILGVGVAVCVLFAAAAPTKRRTNAEVELAALKCIDNKIWHGQLSSGNWVDALFTAGLQVSCSDTMAEYRALLIARGKFVDELVQKSASRSLLPPDTPPTPQPTGQSHEVIF
jgi:hypothetical protein